MTAPQDPFAAPDPDRAGAPAAPSGYGPGGEGAPRWDAPPAGDPTPYAAPPGYGSTPGFGTPPAYGAQAGGAHPIPGGMPPYAPWSRRVGAALVDGLMTGLVAFAFGLVTPGLGDLANLVLFLIFLYLLGTTGQTPGKRLLGIMVLREADGTPLGFPLAVGRAICHILDAIPLLLGFLWPLWDDKKQTFADKVVKSVAVRA